MSQQEPLFFETVNDALKYTVQRLGTTKEVASRLRGDKSPVAAEKWLADCLNESRDARLAPDQVEALVRMGREAGCHAYMHYMASTLGYAVPAPLSREDVKAAATTETLRAAAEISAIFARLQRQGIRLEDLAQGVAP